MNRRPGTGRHAPGRLGLVGLSAAETTEVARIDTVLDRASSIGDWDLYAHGLTAGRGQLTTCFDSIAGKDGSVRMDWLWLWFPADSLRERRIVGVVSEMTEAQALEIAGQL